MTDSELDGFRRQLLEMGKRLKGDFTDLASEALRKTGGEASGNLSNTPMHMADLGTDAYEQEVSMSLLENEGQQLEEITAALGRVEQKTFGRCQECGKEISRERLQALPYTRYCVECARRLEEQGNATPPNP